MSKNIGKITQIISAVVDVEFENAAELPAIYNALTCENDGKQLVLEVSLHIGEKTVRAIAMDSTDGLTRGAEVTDTGSAISVPVGEGTLGRIMNVIGDPIDEKGEIEIVDSFPVNPSILKPWQHFSQVQQA